MCNSCSLRCSLDCPLAFTCIFMTFFRRSNTRMSGCYRDGIGMKLISLELSWRSTTPGRSISSTTTLILTSETFFLKECLFASTTSGSASTFEEVGKSRTTRPAEETARRDAPRGAILAAKTAHLVLLHGGQPMLAPPRFTIGLANPIADRPEELGASSNPQAGVHPFQHQLY